MSSTLIINSNIASLNAQRRLTTSTGTLQKSFERLSSGLRINKASDDAAGLAVASSLNVDSRVYTQGTRNTNDAISLYSIAEGALGSLVNITTRLKELAEQSSNGVLSFTQRKSLDAEAQALGKEYQRIINTTQFNGQQLINGTSGSLNVQAGYDTLSLSGGNSPTGTFAVGATLATGTDPYSLTTADLNGDGNLDLISDDSTSAQLSVFLGTGNGTFQAASTYATGANSQCIRAEDLNRDGIIDLVSADSTSGKVSVYLGNGDGSFKIRQTYVVGTGVSSVAIADFNGDGNADLVTADTGVGSASLLLGNGDGSFKTRQIFGVGSVPVSVTAADLNGDGAMDFVSSDDFSNQLTIYLGNGNGTFQTQKTISSGFNPFFVTTADVNYDGVLDLISADYSSAQIGVYLGNGNGSFKTRQAYSTGSAPLTVTAGDINGDGITDLVSADSASNQLSIFLNNGDGTFKSADVYSRPSLTRAVVLTDINGDNATDILATDQSSEITIFLGNTSSQIVAAPTTGTYSLLTQRNSKDALTQFTKVLNGLTSALGAIGANQSRLETAVGVLQTTKENYLQAASQIMDVDVAQESANLTRTQILQQAGAAVLGQANQQPALALRLLGGI